MQQGVSDASHYFCCYCYHCLHPSRQLLLLLMLMLLVPPPLLLVVAELLCMLESPAAVIQWET